MRQTNYSMNGGRPLVSRNGCKCKYRVRWFYSKGAFLVLVWVILLTMACISVSNVFNVFHQQHVDVYPKWLFGIPLVFGLLGAVFSGWLADAKLGNYRVMKYSFVLLFLLCLLFSAFTLVPGIAHYVYVVSVLYCIGWSLLLIAVVACSVTSLQLGLDQMPDASSSNITSFIAWFVFSMNAGVWISYVADFPIRASSQLPYWVVQLYSLLPPLCMSIVLVLDFLLAKKWLIIEPKSPQSLKTIYRVLKFAAKHKAPLNRSALTYWEEDVPSRMDLGKSRYGGPFTTEQVEDVKTILRLLPLCLALWLLGCSLAIFHPLNHHASVYPPDWKPYVSRLLALFTYHHLWCGMVWTVFYEFLLYPVLRNRLPSIIRRIGIISLFITTFSIVFLILKVLQNNYGDVVAIEHVIIVLNSISRGLLTILLASTMMELVCAQAPYNMRGLFGGCMVLVLFSSLIIGFSIPSNSPLTIYGVKVGISLLGFILYCLLACWYKRRVRDEDYNAHRVVEEVYDRYLSAQH